MNITAIEKIAYKIRAQFEAGLVDRDLLIEMYRTYTDVGNTAIFVNKAKNIFPRGNCGLASLYLKKKLGGEVVRGKYGKHSHTFLLIDDIIIDITADQFGGPEVYVGPLRRPWTLKNRD